MPSSVKSISQTIFVGQPDGGTQFGEVTYVPGGRFGPRQQSGFQLVIVLSGHADIEVDDQELHVPSRHVALLLPGCREFFRFDASGPTRHSWCSISRNLPSRSIAASLASVGNVIPLSHRIQTLMQAGLTLPPSAPPVVQALGDSLALACFHEFLADSAGGFDPLDRVPTAVANATAYAETHLADPISIADLARAAACSPDHLSKLFRRHLDVSPAAWLWQLRTERGISLLLQTGLTISEIAYAVGCSNPFHFSRLVKRATGHSPTALRSRKWAANSPRSGGSDHR